MLIVSKQYDYYDSALGVSGVDKTVVYKRAEKEVEKPKYKSYIEGKYNNNFDKNKNTVIFRKRVIGFCGEIFPMVIITRYNKRFVSPSEEIEMNMIYDSDTLKNRIKDLGMVVENKTGWKWSFGKDKTGMDSDIRSIKGIENFFNKKNWKFLENKFLEYKKPVFLYSEYDGLVLDPILKNYSFAKVKSPFEAFQDIYMYISGVLGVDQNPMVEISDKDKAIKKGHGGKYSFKKPPKKK